MRGPLLSLFFVGGMSVLFCGCGNSMEQVQIFDRQTPPAQTIREGHIIRSEKGLLQFEMTAPLIVKYNEPEQKTLYPEGVEITFFDENRAKKAFFTAREATSWDAKDLLEARDSVVLIDHRSHDTVYLQDLIWDSKQKRIYSDHPLKAVNGQRITFGDRFESDENFENPQILHQRGTIEWNDDEETGA